ncbi:hypothetical protein CMQ_4027 [Grosmannia clavigera kw1407]|uniref:Uncharacterized protein n=1 Tax=Grosmannia clavigera (strain kw1407 / UAMH 11150) TaxID=655863 RepID=F0X9K1_GROCL|nr:uncharacterized protein CMQ_4027 [Grosmannia clavigera kw1407]EFX05958.1 hypothetical protein CMQ_4027 [Grosmannia clavigera kw1407]
MFDSEELVPTLSDVGQFKLEETPEQPKQYFLKFDSRYENDESKARNARPGYILGYTSTGQLSKTPAFVDILKKPDQGPNGYAKTYDAFGKPDRPPEFCPYEIDGAGLVQVEIDSGLIVEDLSSETALTERRERGSGLLGSEAAARSLAENLAFKSVVAAAGAQTVSNVNGPSIKEFNGRRLIRVPADRLTGKIFWLQLNDGEQPGFPCFVLVLPGDIPSERPIVYASKPAATWKRIHGDRQS